MLINGKRDNVIYKLPYYDGHTKFIYKVRTGQNRNGVKIEKCNESGIKGKKEQEQEQEQME